MLQVVRTFKNCPSPKDSSGFISLFLVSLAGLLLALLVALCPQDSYATTELLSYPKANTNLAGMITHKIYGGCDFRSYTLTNGATPYLGSLRDGIHNCGYRPSGNSINFTSLGDSLVGSAVTNISNGVSSNFTYSQKGGYNILNYWDSTWITAEGSHFHNSLNSIEIYAVNNDNGNISNGFISPSVNNGYSIFAYRYDGNGVSGTTVQINRTASNIVVANSSDNSAWSTADISDFIDKINDTIIFSCTSEFNTNLLPSEFSDWFANWNDSCYIIFMIPLSTEYYVTFNQIVFSPASGINYAWRPQDCLISGIVCSQSGVLSLDGYYGFIQYSPSYKSMSGHWDDSLKPTNQKFSWLACSSSDECDSWSNYNSLYKGIRQQNFTEPTGSSQDSIFMQWFNVFNFGFVFPFRNFFSSFTDSTDCVNVPIIGGMLHNPNAQYCSWWSSSIRSTLTPVFNIFALIIFTSIAIMRITVNAP